MHTPICYIYTYINAYMHTQECKECRVIQDKKAKTVQMVYPESGARQVHRECTYKCANAYNVDDECIYTYIHTQASTGLQLGKELACRLRSEAMEPAMGNPTLWGLTRDNSNHHP